MTGALYLGEALARLFPQLHDDLYFRYGSQGQFTLVPIVYASLISAFGVGGGTIVGLWLAFGLYFSACWYLIGRISAPSIRHLCVLSVLLGWSIYGGHRIFSVCRTISTARSFAEPAVLFGFGLLVRGRVVFACSMMLGAALLHPLVAIGGLLVAWVFLTLGDRRWLALGIGAAIAALLLGMYDRPPFNDLLTRYDPAWLNSRT